MERPEHIWNFRNGGYGHDRTYVSLEGEGLQEGKGDCPNPFYAPSDIRKPLVSKEINPQWPIINRTYEYDILTEAGKEYRLVRSVE